MTYNTGNPIGSTDARDRSDNSENLDLAVNSLSQTFVDRLGVTRDTLEGIYQKSAYYRAGTFNAGYTLTNNRQTLAYGNVEYSWSGAFPKVVPAGSTPSTAGGVGVGLWVDRTDLMLRSDINIVQKRFSCVADMVADTALTVGKIVATIGYYSGYWGTTIGPVGGNRYEIVAAGTGTVDGGSFIALSNGLQAKALFSDVINFQQFGAYSDGVHDDSTAVKNTIAYACSVKKSIHVVGNSLVSQLLTVTAGIRMFGDGFSATNGATAASQITKAASLSGNLISVTGTSAVLENFGCQGLSGNSGDGVQVIAGRVCLRDISSNGMGGVGIRVGGDNDENCNAFKLDRVTTNFNGSHGIYVHDSLSTGGPDANAGVINLPISSNNGGDGIRLNECWYNTIVGPLTQVNAGYGINIICTTGASYLGSRYHTIIGGDQNETNALGNIYNSGYRCTFIGTDYVSFTDIGTYTNVVTSQGTKFYSATFNSTAGGTDDGAVLAQGWLGSTIYPVIIRNTANASNGRGVGIKFQVPYGTASFSNGGAIVSAQEATNYDYLDFYVNKSSALTAMFRMSPLNNAFMPSIDNTYSLGLSSYRFAVVYAGTGTISTSDERLKTFCDNELSDAVLDVWSSIDWRSFKFNDSIQIKGENARVHFGLGAQTVKKAFEDARLDPFKYALLCYDEWDAIEEVRDENGTILQEAREAGNRYGIRYEEALILESTLMRRTTKLLKEKLAQIEEKLSL